MKPGLQQTLGQPGFEWLIAKLKKCLEAGKPLPKSVSRPQPTSEEVEAFRRFFGKTGTPTSSLKIKMAELELLLKTAQLAPSVEKAVEILAGPIVNRKAIREQEAQAWSALLQSTEAFFPNDPLKQEWIRCLFEDNTLMRLTEKKLDEAENLLQKACKVADRLPARDIPLAQLAAEATGNAHDLDRGEKLGQLMVRLASRMGPYGSWKSEEGRRQVWEQVGVLCDQLSAPVLVWNLNIPGVSFCNRILTQHAEIGLPCRLMTQHLIHHPLDGSAAPSAKVIFVCENPSVVQAVSQTWPRSTFPLICTEGPLKTAARLLLDQMSQMGFTFRYHGDFEWKGIQMANHFLERYPTASPWRLSAQDYLQVQGKSPLEGTPTEAHWDSHLMETMKTEGYAMFEEQVLSKLLNDLSVDSPHD